MLLKGEKAMSLSCFGVVLYVSECFSTRLIEEEE